MYLARKKMFPTMQSGAAPVTFLLRDDFTTDRAAGAINGTAAESGGAGGATLNTRVVVDSTSKLTISNDYFVCAGGLASPVWTDPNMRYGTFVRQAGYTFLACVQPRARDKDWQIGWTRTAASLVRSHGIYFGSNDLIIIWHNNGQDSTYTSYTPYAEFLIAIGLRTTGADYLIKGDQMYQAWTKLKTIETLTDANMYPAIENNSAPFRVSTLRIPDKNYQPYIDAGNYNILNNAFKPYTSHRVFAVGDSRTIAGVGAGRWPSLLTRYSQGHEFLESPTRVAGSGWTVASVEAALPAALAAATTTPDFVWIDIGINDNGATAEATFKASLLNVLDLIHAKWANVPIYVDNVAKLTIDTTDLNNWIDYCIAQRSTFTYAGTDERDYAEGNMQGDNVHFTDYGYYVKANAILTRLGYLTGA